MGYLATQYAGPEWLPISGSLYITSLELHTLISSKTLVLRPFPILAILNPSWLVLILYWPPVPSTTLPEARALPTIKSPKDVPPFLFFPLYAHSFRHCEPTLAQAQPHA